jgi:hypothetical protein
VDNDGAAVTSSGPPNRARLSACGVLVVALAALAASPAPTAGRKTVSVMATAAVLQPASITVVQYLSTGAVKTHGNDLTGAVIIPASYPTLADPPPVYPGTDPVKGAKAQTRNAAEIEVAGSPGAEFTLNFQGWSEVSGAPGSTASAAANTYYSPGNFPINVARGVFDAQGRATIYIGSTVTVARSNSGTTVVMKPSFTIM